MIGLLALLVVLFLSLSPPLHLPSPPPSHLLASIFSSFHLHIFVERIDPGLATKNGKFECMQISIYFPILTTSGTVLSRFFPSQLFKKMKSMGKYYHKFCAILFAIQIVASMDQHKKRKSADANELGKMRKQLKMRAGQEGRGGEAAGNEAGELHEKLEHLNIGGGGGGREVHPVIKKEEEHHQHFDGEEHIRKMENEVNLMNEKNKQQMMVAVAGRRIKEEPNNGEERGGGNGGDGNDDFAQGNRKHFLRLFEELDRDLRNKLEWRREVKKILPNASDWRQLANIKSKMRELKAAIARHSSGGNDGKMATGAAAASSSHPMGPSTAESIGQEKGVVVVVGGGGDGEDDDAVMLIGGDGPGHSLKLRPDEELTDYLIRVRGRI